MIKVPIAVRNNGESVVGDIISGARRLSTAAMKERSARAATGFAMLGIQEGDVIALFLRNDFPFFEASLAAGLLGAYSTPVNWHSTEEEARYVLENSGAKAILIHSDLLEPIASAIPPGVQVLIAPTPPEVAQAYDVPPERQTVVAGAIDWEGWLSGFDPWSAPPRPAPGAMIYTSGTTGLPKGVRRAPPTPEQRRRATESIAHVFGFDRKAPEDIRTVIVGPMYHSAPNRYGLMAMRAGATVHLQPRFDPEALLQTIERERITHFHAVPIMFTRLLKLPRETRERYDLSSLEYVVHAAAPCPPPVKRAMIDWWGPVIYEYFGSTETGSLTLCTPKESLERPGTVGRPLSGAEVRIVDADGQSLPAGEIGEVVAKFSDGSDFTYHGDDAKRRAADRGGLVATGDIGFLDADGFLFLCDRVKDLIISGGVNIYPAEIEAVLHRMPGVSDCAVFGIPDDDYGEAVHAVVQPSPGADLTEDDVRAYLRRHLSGFKTPRTLTFATDLPREDSGKIFKRRLREPFWAGRPARI